MKPTVLIGIIAALAMCAVLAAGCPRKPSQGGSSSKLAQTSASSESEDTLAWALGHESPDVSQFALLAIANYRLDGYQEQLRSLSPNSAVASMVLAAIYKDPDSLHDYFVGQPPGSRVGDILGAAYGLGCAREVPAAAWLRLSAEAEESELTELLWGLAQLDVEPGGPLEHSEMLSEWLGDLRKSAVDSGDVDRRGALDALLGDAGGEIDWQVYQDYLPESHWNSVKWTALLRWAPKHVWQDMLGDSSAHEAIQLELGRALILSGPAELGLPGSDARLTTMGLGLELRAVKFAQGKVDTMELPELDTLIGQSDLLQSKEAQESEGNRYRQQAYQLALASVLQVLDYALILGDQQLVGRLIDAMPNLPELARNGILATIKRREPNVLTDEQLASLVKLEDAGVCYFLIQGWYDRQVVQDSDAAELVANTPGQENSVTAYAYRLWLKRM